ncbi:MAG: DUF1294 domain-containing protein [Clostridia bacterium]|nr:DUF1294 domain-containing protein [Clostridia bacterium]MBQ2190822.1 DUF1294 domain-containing protein [Clostridia bacterium]MBQ3939316.1 DUF1294 domain-containing protein [Clostridia bacterium]
MKTWQIIVLAFIFIMSVVGFISMGADKQKAKKGKWRTPEATLFIIALLGGALGSVIGMQVFRHKTKHWYFALFMPLILVAQIALVAFLFVKFG